TVRVYLMANVPHFALANGEPMRPAMCQQATNPLHAGAPMRALLVAMDKWLTTGAVPPPSRYPSRRDGTLVTPETAASAFPTVSGFTHRGVINRLAVVDHTVMPPTKGKPYPVFVGKTDADGHDLAGIRLPALDAPLATYISWNYRQEGFAGGDLCDLYGSILPLAATKAARLATGDQRLSLEERYPHAGDYAAAVSAAARRLVEDRLMLAEDAARIVEAASRSPVNAAR
ncbi:MAG TPA: alpha/beta hydrolase domain-containing protein, partial [Stellaceae bacterium]|nr:alpha/beta hydrolase domain-containing protein [Stellaceae bacterium]